MRTPAAPAGAAGPYVNTAIMPNKQEIVIPDDIRVDIESDSVSNTMQTANIIYNKVPDSKPYKVAVCCGGLESGSLKYTCESIKKNIIEILMEEFSVDVFVHDLRGTDIKDKTYEHHRLFDDIDAAGLIKTYISNDAVNDGIDRMCKKGTWDESRRGNNFMRELYMEENSYRIIKEYQRKNNVHYNAVVHVRPNMFIAKPIAISEVHKVISNPKAMYCCSFNDWDGYGVGFYIGTDQTLDIITTRINNLPADKISSEKLLKRTIDSAKLKRYKSTMFYFKINNSGTVDVYYQLLKKFTTPSEYMDAKKAYQLATSTNPKNKVHHRHSTATTDDLAIRPRLSQLRKQKRRSCPH